MITEFPAFPSKAYVCLRLAVRNVGRRAGPTVCAASVNMKAELIDIKLVRKDGRMYGKTARVTVSAVRRSFLDHDAV